MKMSKSLLGAFCLCAGLISSVSAHAGMNLGEARGAAMSLATAPAE